VNKYHFKRDPDTVKDSKNDNCDIIVIYVEQDDDINVTRIRISESMQTLLFIKDHIGLYVLELYPPASWLLLQCFFFSSAVSFMFFSVLMYDKKKI
jgi:hypothetical protein